MLGILRYVSGKKPVFSNIRQVKCCTPAFEALNHAILLHELVRQVIESSWLREEQGHTAPSLFLPVSNMWLRVKAIPSRRLPIGMLPIGIPPR